MDIKINGNTVSVSALTTAQIVDTYNELASALGETPVNRFANRSKAESRLIGIADRHNEKFPHGGDTSAEQHPVQLNEEDRAQITAEVQSRPAVTDKANRWARAKYEAPSKVAYRPRPNSSQRVMYDLLTQPGGILIEEFCEEMQQFKDKTLHQPSSVWSCLRYLFVTSKGYGLDFDGARLQLLVPADERDVVRAKN